ncbi:signal peptidase I, partial [Enterococcus faecalis]|nr:signal peptidase I [Enterococcus faecalis]
LMTKLSKNYNRKDIVVAENPIKENKNIIKRVIGLPGETLEIINDKVYINNHKLKEPYAYFSTKDQSNAVKNYKKIYIPKNRIFVMGDNRYNSFDSREFGTIDINSIQGKIFHFK